MKDYRHKRLFQRLIFILFIGLISLDMLCYINRYKTPWGFWWGTWLMYAYTLPQERKLITLGTLENGNDVQIDLKKWFHFYIGFERLRYEYCADPSPSKKTTQFANYICKKYNEEAPSGAKLAMVTFKNIYMKKTTGRKISMKDLSVPDQSFLVKRSCLNEFQNLKTK